VRCATGKASVACEFPDPKSFLKNEPNSLAMTSKVATIHSGVQPTLTHLKKRPAERPHETNRPTDQQTNRPTPSVLFCLVMLVCCNVGCSDQVAPMSTDFDSQATHDRPTRSFGFVDVESGATFFIPVAWFELQGGVWLLLIELLECPRFSIIL
jgi:hypothetical protein